MIREEVRKLVELGPLPPSTNTDSETIDRHWALLAAISRPISVEEAEALVALFGPDECFGLVWSLIHLLESAPGWPLEYLLTDMSNEWIRLLLTRAHNADEDATETNE